MKLELEKYWLYRNRHSVGMALVFVILGFFIIWGFDRLPIGLSEFEMQSAALSGNISFPESIVDLPYHFLQWLSIGFFGLSQFSIRLPSVILAFFGGIFIMGGIRNLTKNNVAIITGLVISSSVFFLDFARIGAPMIMNIFLFSLTIFSLTQYLFKNRRNVIWLVLAIAAIILETYSPLGIYTLLALLLLSIAHPKARLFIAKIKLWHKLLLLGLLLIVMAPMVYAAILSPSIIPDLLGIGQFQIAPAEIGNSFQVLFNPSGTEFAGLATPLINFVELALMALGIVALVKNRQSIRSYLTLGLAALTLVFALADITKSYLLFLPMIFLIAFGVQEIINRWYGLFPFNPYARFLGLVPILILVSSLTFSNYALYVSDELYDKDVVYGQSLVFSVVKETVNDLSAHDVNLVVSNDELDFYRLLEKDYPNLKVRTEIERSAETKILIPSTFEKNYAIPNLAKFSNTADKNVLVKIYQNSVK
ncbi:MAG: glycosyltransferase family 39 protein [Candidatus Nomurabacteria bacterium]|jgi:hypothetical protein|nr:glycosyltransferase family 39 protein [Candidatus Nomurabacteria bacterium]